jgi:hypothetical protein
MATRTATHQDIDLPILIYMVVLSIPVAVLAFSLHWLLQPIVIPNPGLTGYILPRAQIILPAGDEDESFGLMERMAEKAAAEANLALLAEANPEKGVQKANMNGSATKTKNAVRKVQRIVRSPAPTEALRARAEASSFHWNDGPHRYAGRWGW